MKTEDILRIIENLENELKILKNRVDSMTEMQAQLNEVDERTLQLKRYKQIGHPDFGLGD